MFCQVYTPNQLCLLLSQGQTGCDYLQLRMTAWLP